MAKNINHTISYDGERRTVSASRYASVLDVLEIAFPNVDNYDMTRVHCIGAGRTADKELSPLEQPKWTRVF